jgi:hypothetical protein
MTFEEYKKKRSATEPRSIPITILFPCIFAVAAASSFAILFAIVESGFDLGTFCIGIILLLFAVYAGICAADGKKKTAKEALFDLAWLLPF